MDSPPFWTYVFLFWGLKILGFYSAFFKNRARTAWPRVFLLSNLLNKDSQARNRRKNECLGGSKLRDGLLFPTPPSVAAQVFSPTLFKKPSVAAQVFPRSNSMSKVTGLWVSLSGWREGRLRVRGWSTQDRGGGCLLFSEPPSVAAQVFPMTTSQGAKVCL